MKAIVLICSLLILAGCKTDDKTPTEIKTDLPVSEQKFASALSSILQRKDTTTEGMVWTKGGTFEMGCKECGMPDALPMHEVTVAGFWIDETPVTNAQFAEFVKATGYKTVAEQPLSKEEFPRLSDEERQPGSIVLRRLPLRLT